MSYSQRLTDLINITEKDVEGKNSITKRIQSFSKRIDVKEATTKNYIYRNSIPGADYVEKILASIENINIEWFLSGEGEMFNSKNSQEGNMESSLLTQERAIPIYDIEVRAGKMARLIEDNENIPVIGWYYLKDHPNTEGILGVKAVGDSMFPFISGGDILLIRRIDKNSYIASNLAYVIITKNLTVVKYIEKGPSKSIWTLISHNERYKPDPIEVDEIIHLFVVVKVHKELTH